MTTKEELIEKLRSDDCDTKCCIDCIDELREKLVKESAADLFEKAGNNEALRAAILHKGVDESGG